jgi:hypothetical protein
MENKELIVKLVRTQMLLLEKIAHLEMNIQILNSPKNSPFSETARKEFFNKYPNYALNDEKLQELMKEINEEIK